MGEDSGVVVHELQKLAIAGSAFLLTVALGLGQVITENFDAENLIGYGIGAVGTGSVFYLVWTDRRGMTRADHTQEARLTELKSQLKEITEEKDFWRARALGIETDPHTRSEPADIESVGEVPIVQGE